MNNEEMTSQQNNSVKYQEWVVEFDPDLKVAFDDELDFDLSNENSSFSELMYI